MSNNSYVNSDTYEDPTYLIFDMKIITEESPLFENLLPFMENYADAVPEIAERIDYYQELINNLLKIFPTDRTDENDGTKRHYIESLTGLDVLQAKIVNYPEDIITITLSDDITLITHYLAELYNNLVYSYDTRRYLIPENLLRFNVEITVKDIRNEKKVDYINSSEDTKELNVINNDVSLLIYTLHDCQFNFYDTKSFGNEITVGGWGAALPNTPAKNSLNFNFKSISRITAPNLIDFSKVIDFKERNINADYNLSNTENYMSQEFYEEAIENNEENTNFKSLGGSFSREISDVRNVLVNQLNEEVGQLVTAGNQFLGENLGFTLGKFNVYYESLGSARQIDKFSFMFEDFLDDSIDELFGRNITYPDARDGNIYSENEETTVVTNKVPTGEDRHADGTYNEKPPTGEDRHVDGAYNEKPPTGEDRHVDGAYNEKLPDGDLHPDGTYNEKLPDGDLHPDGTYNEKLPNGNVYKNTDNN